MEFKPFEESIPMGQRLVGICSICGGPVTIPDVFYSLKMPEPTCQLCHAVEKSNYGPVIDMEPVKYGNSTTTEPKNLVGSFTFSENLKFDMGDSENICKNCGTFPHICGCNGI